MYRDYGIEGLFLTEDSLRGDWPRRIMAGIEGVLKNRFDRFYNREKYTEEEYLHNA